MNRTPPKRTASRSPENGRPHKRLATSSPEEGEVDDETHDGVNAVPLSRPVTPTKSSSKPPKVAFPFKKKNGVESTLPLKPTVSLQDGPVASAAVIYERSAEDERRIREKELQRKPYVPHPESRRSGYPADHWEPSRGYRQDDRRGAHDYHASSSHTRRDHRDRSRGRSSPSPARSSPSSTSTRRGKHRLPRRDRTPTYSPPRREYNIDRIRDNREREDASHRSRGGDRIDDHNHYRDGGRHHDRGDGYWRPPSPRHETRDRRDEYDHRDPYLAPRRRDVDSYHPSSPGPSVRTASTATYPPRSPSPLGPRTPPLINGPRTPPPPSEPPPPPPPAEDDAIPPSRTAFFIPLPPKPPAPVNVHSPTPMPLPPAPSVVKRDRETVVVKEVRKREPVRRSREEDFEAYGRSFEGCGAQADYDVTTKLGEGTFGEVHKAIHKHTHRAVALKRILMHNEKEGMPVTALREIKILKALKHPCIVDILDMFVVRSKGKQSPLSVYMVFPYMDHDLAGLLENERVKLQPSHIKLYMKQLLEGTEYMHRNRILHRDMKAANLLISNDGTLRIADFGLARAYDPTAGRSHGKERKYTNCVVTRWYRPPELLLGARQYGGEVDLWGIGCVLGEMFMRKPILPGVTDVDQLEKIWVLCGTPNQHTWPNYDDLPGCEGVKRFATHSRRLKQSFETIGPETCDLLDKLLTCNPSERITATDALDHDYFWTDPLPADPKTLPSYEASHELDKRSRRVMPQGNPQMPPDGPSRPQGQPPFMNQNRPPPTRESFHNGPPRGGMYPGHGPPSTRPPFMPSHGYPPNGAAGHALPGPGPPFRPDRRDQRGDRPNHLPPKPSGGPPRGGGPNRGGGWRGGGVTGGGGGRPGPVNASSAGGLSYD